MWKCENEQRSRKNAGFRFINAEGDFEIQCDSGSEFIAER